MARDGWISTQLASALLSLSIAGCSCTTNLGSTGGDGGLDASRPPVGAYDECGNGLDDDGDGAIDEDCPCSTDEVQPCWDGLRTERAVGECADGEQRCSATGSTEFGRWLECTSTRGPATERCEGSRDEDCDGAIDEGCTPCEEGATRVCGVEFIEPPCTSGTQTCRDGTWGACEDAIGPTAEVCADGVDNDCDGEVDDASFCMCSPVPEICGNGVDDDCDGAADEPPCGALPDAGTPDGGVCMPRACGASDCGTLDDGCGASLDCGACAATCSPTLTRVGTLPGAHLDRLVRTGGVLYGRFDAVGGGTTLRTIDPTDWSTTVIHDVGTYLSPNGFAVDADRLCFASPTGGVRCGPIAGPYDALPVPSGLTSNGGPVAIHGEDVYWSANTGETRPRRALLRTTGGATTELWRSDAFADGATVLSGMHQLVADATGVSAVLQGIHFVHYTHSSGGEAGATGAFSTDGTHEEVVHITREGTSSPRWSSGPLTPIAAPGPRSATHWNTVLATAGGARVGTQLFWAESAEGWGVTAEVSTPAAASPDNPLRLRTRSLDGSDAVATLIDDASTTRRSVFWVHPTARFVYLMSYVYTGTDVVESRIERAPRAGGPLETVASLPTSTPLRALSAVSQIGECLIVGIRRGNFDSEIHTIRVE